MGGFLSGDVEVALVDAALPLLKEGGHGVYLLFQLDEFLLTRLSI